MHAREGPQARWLAVHDGVLLMGKNITLVGANGDGQTAKAANQIIVALNIEAVAEALLFASRTGADSARVRQALRGGFTSRPRTRRPNPHRPTNSTGASPGSHASERAAAARRGTNL